MAKRLIKDNTGRGRDLKTNEVMRALLQYLTTPLRGVTDSPAKIVFGRPISDSLPKSPMKKDWTSRNHHNKLGMAKIRATSKEKLDEHTKILPSLKVGETRTRLGQS